MIGRLGIVFLLYNNDILTAYHLFYFFCFVLSTTTLFESNEDTSKTLTQSDVLYTVYCHLYLHLEIVIYFKKMQFMFRKMQLFVNHDCNLFVKNKDYSLSIEKYIGGFNCLSVFYF